MHHEDSFIVRIGLFFLVLGGGSFLLFVVSDLAHNANFDFLFIAMVLMAIGFPMYRKRPPPPPSGRFEYLRRLRGGRGGGHAEKKSEAPKENAGEHKE